MLSSLVASEIFLPLSAPATLSLYHEACQERARGTAELWASERGALAEASVKTPRGPRPVLCPSAVDPPLSRTVDAVPRCYVRLLGAALPISLSQRVSPRGPARAMDVDGRADCPGSLDPSLSRLSATAYSSLAQLHTHTRGPLRGCARQHTATSRYMLARACGRVLAVLSAARALLHTATAPRGAEHFYSSLF